MLLYWDAFLILYNLHIKVTTKNPSRQTFFQASETRPKPTLGIIKEVDTQRKSLWTHIANVTKSKISHNSSRHFN